MLARFLFFVHFTFFGSILFLFYSSLFFFLVYIYLFILYFKYNICCLYVSSTVFDSYVLCACICWFLCVCLSSMYLCVCVSCIASTDVNFNLSLYINPSIHRTAYTSQRLPLFTLLFNFCIALTLKGWTECDGESVTMRYR